MKGAALVVAFQSFLRCPRDPKQWIFEFITGAEGAVFTRKKIPNGECFEWKTDDGYLIRIFQMDFYYTYFNACIIHPVDFFLYPYYSSLWKRHADFEIATRTILPEIRSYWDLYFLSWKGQTNEHTCKGPLEICHKAFELVEEWRQREQAWKFREKQKQTRIIFQELMSKSLHPKRVAAWVMAGMEL